jgi:hypothetical protein
MGQSLFIVRSRYLYKGIRLPGNSHTAERTHCAQGYFEQMDYLHCLSSDPSIP